jgi:SAM-dependent methyltransferase
MQIPPPSPWVARHAGLVPRPGPVLDLAAGSGRHARHFKDLGYIVTALDRDIAGLSALAADCEIIAADLESGAPWPLAGRQFGGIVVTNYLHRPMLSDLAAALAPGGVLIYETFGTGNERLGKPSNPNFLLRPGELLEFAETAGLTVLAYSCGEAAWPKPAVRQALAARKAGFSADPATGP